METAQEALKCLALALMCSVLLGIAVLTWKAPGMLDRAARETRTAVIAEIDSQANQTRAALLTEASRWERDANERLGGALSEIRTTEQDANSRTEEALEIVRDASVKADAHLANLEGIANRQLTGLNITAASMAVPIAESAKQVDDALPLWLDCQFNPDCAFNRYQGVSKAFEKTAQVIAREAPLMTEKADSIAGSVESVSQSVAKEAEVLTRPQTKMQQFRSWLLLGTRVFAAF